MKSKQEMIRSYEFLSVNNIISEDLFTKILADDDFLLESYIDIDWIGHDFHIDRLPIQMDSEIYFIEFEYEKNSDNLIWRDNFDRDSVKFERILLMAMAYADEVFLHSSYLPQGLLKIESEIDYRIAKQTISFSLSGDENTILSFPQNKTLICFNSLFLTVIEADSEFRKLLGKMVLAEGLYIR